MSGSSGRNKHVRGLVLLTIVAGLLGAAPRVAMAGRNAPSCNPRKTACGSTTDTAAPTVSIMSPASGTTVAGSASVTGSASDNVGVTKVEIGVDGVDWRLASGTSQWSASIDTTAYADGNHTLNVRASDAAGNVGVSSEPFTVANAATDGVIQNPAVPDGIVLAGRGRSAEFGSLSALIYQARSSHEPWAYFRDSTTGASSHVSLPVDRPAGSDWGEASYFLSEQRELWVFSGGGPLYVRRYSLSGDPLPTAATLLSVTAFGDSDSRPGDFIELNSGAILAVWHQQGATGPQGQWVARRNSSGAWSTLELRFMPTASSVQAVAQHPSDGSIWLFSDPDAWGAIGVAHLTETTSGMAVDWTNASFIGDADGLFNADPENPQLDAAADASTGTIALAYQSADRRIFSSSPFVAGSRIAVARIRADRSKSFIATTDYTERIAKIGLVVRPGETWVLYRRVDQVAFTFNDLYVSAYRGGAWGPASFLGTLFSPYDPVAFGMSRAEFAARLGDGQMHRWAM